MKTVQAACRTIVFFLFFGNVLNLATFIIQMLFVSYNVHNLYFSTDMKVFFQGESFLFYRNFGAFSLTLVQVYVFCNAANDVMTEVNLHMSNYFKLKHNNVFLEYRYI